LIDFLKSEIIHLDPDKLEANEYLDFERKVNMKTGEIGVYINSYYRGLEFRIYETTVSNPIRRITLEGSLHKYWNDGKHNYNDFTDVELKWVVWDILLKFNISPLMMCLKQLEIGVNISPPVPTKEILMYCLLHKTKLLKSVFTKDEGNYKQVQHCNYFIKIYDKQKHYNSKGYHILNQIFRFEIKYKREKLSNVLNKKGRITLQEVLDFSLHNFKSKLIQEWNNILFYDSKTLEKSKYKDRYSNPNFWLNLKPENFKYHRRILNKLINSNSENIKKQIELLISNKIDKLCYNTTQIQPLYIVLNKVV